MFGAFGSTPAPAGGLFGAAPAAAAAPNPFGAAPAGGGLFGAAPAPAAGGLFGAAPAAAPAAGGLFGAAPAPAVAGGLFGAAPAPAAAGGLFGAAAPAPGGGLFGAAAPRPMGGGLFGGAAPAPAAGGLFGAAPAPAPGLAPPPSTQQQQLRLKATFENLPRETQDWLSSTERRINEWRQVAERFPATSFDIGASDRAAAELAREAQILGDRARLDGAMLVGFKEQVRLTPNSKSCRGAEYLTVIYICVCVCVCIYIHMCVCICIHAYVCMYVIYIHIYIYIYIYIYNVYIYHRYSLFRRFFSRRSTSPSTWALRARRSRSASRYWAASFPSERQTSATWVRFYLLSTRNEKGNSVFYSYVACFGNTLALDMYVLLGRFISIRVASIRYLGEETTNPLIRVRSVYNCNYTYVCI